MKLYLRIKKMTFNEEDNLVEHKIISAASDKEFMGYDYMIELSNNDKFIKDTLKIEYKKDKEGKKTDEIKYRAFMVREQKTWNSFPLYEIIDDKIVDFNYKQYSYFANTDRRMTLALKINEVYNPPSELKLHRKILKKILEHLGITNENFEKYNTKVNEIIKKNPK